METTTQAPATVVRWMLHRDIVAVERIEAATFANPQSAGEIAKQVRERNCIGLVAEREGQVVGFVIYQVFRLRRVIICMAVDPQHHRAGIASSMLSYLLTGITRKRESQPCTITALVRENNLPTLNLLKSQGFRAVKLHRAACHILGVDAIEMEWRNGG